MCDKNHTKKKKQLKMKKLKKFNFNIKNSMLN